VNPVDPQWGVIFVAALFLWLLNATFEYVRPSRQPGYWRHKPGAKIEEGAFLLLGIFALIVLWLASQ
jgi:hypothetical protein